MIDWTVDRAGNRSAMRRARLDAQFDLAMEGWDAHISRCRECLREAEHLCSDGMYLQYDVSRARLDIELYEVRRTESLVDATRRLGMPGVGA